MSLDWKGEIPFLGGDAVEEGVEEGVDGFGKEGERGGEGDKTGWSGRWKWEGRREIPLIYRKIC